MDDIERSKIRLQHWIEHNVDHLKGYKKVVQTLRQHGMIASAEAIERGIKLVEEVNAAFREGLSALPNSGTAGSSDKAHDEHEHGHGHEHHHHSHHHDDS